jgi:hypothetical protein
MRLLKPVLSINLTGEFTESKKKKKKLPVVRLAVCHSNATEIHWWSKFRQHNDINLYTHLVDLAQKPARAQFGTLDFEFVVLFVVLKQLFLDGKSFTLENSARAASGVVF